MLTNCGGVNASVHRSIAWSGNRYKARPILQKKVNPVRPAQTSGQGLRGLKCYRTALSNFKYAFLNKVQLNNSAALVLHRRGPKVTIRSSFQIFTIQLHGRLVQQIMKRHQSRKHREIGTEPDRTKKILQRILKVRKWTIVSEKCNIIVYNFSI